MLYVEIQEDLKGKVPEHSYPYLAKDKETNSIVLVLGSPADFLDKSFQNALTTILLKPAGHFKNITSEGKFFWIGSERLLPLDSSIIIHND